MQRTLAELRVGTRQKMPRPLPLRAGLLTLDLVSGGLRNIRFASKEILRAVAYVVRDQNWGTYAPEITDCVLKNGTGAFSVTYKARCVSADAHQMLSYEAHISGDTSGHLLFEVVAEPLTPFLTARCGFAVLHPIDGVAGEGAVVEHVDGTREQASFPRLIEPAQPFKEIRSIQHRVAAGMQARCIFYGDTFEMEDQRNWSDASFKTYVRPLSLPWPYVMDAGVRNKQAVELQILLDEGLHPKPAASKAGAVQVNVGGPDGAFPAIGVSVYPDLIADAVAHPELLLRLEPQLLLFHYNPNGGHGEKELAAYARLAGLLPAGAGTESFLEFVLPAQRDVSEELSGLAASVAEAGLHLSGILVSPAVDLKSTLPGSVWPACPPLGEIYQAARTAFPGLVIGGGSLSYFTELNRKRPPMDLLDFASHCTCPIVHAADDLSVMESLQALPHIVRSARAVIGDKGYRIGPSTIGMRHNPYGARVIDNPGKQRIAMTDRDPRQASLFAAAWMVGYAAATAEARLQSLTVASLCGCLGLASAPTGGRLELYPAFYAASGLAELAGSSRYDCQSSDPARVTGVAGVDREGRRVAWLANLTAQKQTVSLDWGGETGSVQLLDELSLGAPDAGPWRTAEGNAPVDLLPYALACFRFVRC